MVLLHTLAELQEDFRQLDWLRLSLSEYYALVKGFLFAQIGLAVSVASVYVCSCIA